MTQDYKTRYQYLEIRSLVIQAIRDFFTSNQYLEVETPIRCPSVIPEAQIDPLTSEGYYLQASPELCMKRLLSKGFNKIFQICKCFRKNERGPRHLPELTLLEWYAKDNTYLDLMDHCEKLIHFIAERLGLEGKIKYQNTVIDLTRPWKRLTIKKAFERYSDESVAEAIENNSFDEIISFNIEPYLGFKTPAFLTDYPACHASLAKLHPGNKDYAQRFEFYMAGIELANGFTELTDPVEQKIRFEKENQIRKFQNKPPLPIPDKFIKELQFRPDAAVIALGVDRLIMIFCDTVSIDDVVTFTPEIL